MTCFYFPRVTILTIIQFCNFIVWAFIALYQIFGIYGQIGAILVVGLMGGCSYSNCMYQILNNEKLTRTQKEVAITIALIYNDIGILLSAIFSVVIITWVVPVN